MTNPSQGKEAKVTKQSSAHKRQLQNEKRRTQNKASRSRIRTAVRGFRDALGSLTPAQSAAQLNEIYSLVDRAAKKGLFSTNKSARIKSRLTAASRAVA